MKDTLDELYNTCDHCGETILDWSGAVTLADGHSYKTYHEDCHRYLKNPDLSDPTRFHWDKPIC